MKKSTIILALIAFVFVTKISAQGLMPDSYAGIPQSSKTRIFMDNFDDDRYSWIKNASSSGQEIIDGYYMFSNAFDFPNTDGKAISFDATQNFEIETKIKFVSGDVEKFSGLFWGELVFGDKYFFGFSSMGSYVINKEVGFNTNNILPETKSEIINKTAENSLTVRKYGDKYYFFLNQNLIYTMDYEELPGQFIGFTVADKSLIQINFLRLWKIQ